MSRSRSARMSVFGHPVVDPRAITWRLMLVWATSSGSTIVRRPMPVRARHSAVHPPTPPMPNTMADEAARRSICSSPMRRRVRSKRRSVTVVMKCYVCVMKLIDMLELRRLLGRAVSIGCGCRLPERHDCRLRRRRSSSEGRSWRRCTDVRSLSLSRNTIEL